MSKEMDITPKMLGVAGAIDHDAVRRPGPAAPAS